MKGNTRDRQGHKIHGIISLPSPTGLWSSQQTPQGPAMQIPHVEPGIRRRKDDLRSESQAKRSSSSPMDLCLIGLHTPAPFSRQQEGNQRTDSCIGQGRWESLCASPGCRPDTRGSFSYYTLPSSRHLCLCSLIPVAPLPLHWVSALFMGGRGDGGRVC